MKKFIIIGTAGRDKTKPMNLALWKWMLFDARARIPKGSRVVSGGAAWADHIAISLFLFDHASGIDLHLPAPFVNGRFTGEGYKSAGNIANYYHELFGQTIGRDTLDQIQQVVNKSWVTPPGTINLTSEAYSAGLGGMFARNALVASHKDAHMLAYTFGEGDVPADGGTKNTWDKFPGQKTHISLPINP